MGRKYAERQGLMHAMETVVPIGQMAGDDEEDSELLWSMYNEAENYLLKMKWCAGIKASYFGVGIGGIVAVFLFQIDPSRGADEWVWVVSGDVPVAYLDTAEAEEPIRALELYCDVMADWVSAVRAKGSMDRVYPLDVPADEAHANLLEVRIDAIRTELLPVLKAQIESRSRPSA